MKARRFWLPTLVMALALVGMVPAAHAYAPIEVPVALNRTATAPATLQAISVVGSVVRQTCLFGGDVVRIDLTATANSTSQPVRFTWDLNNDGRPDTALSTNPDTQTFWVDESVKTVRVYAVNAAGEITVDRVPIFTRRCE